MEFLLINHPLDCPICDQGGECPLQDQAMGYGRDVSQYSESKRVVADKDIGPLITTFMTRCIHCTRCVRFGRELAGVMELGMTGRGEHSEIHTFLDRSVDSEISGNVIDICPVGALTSKPFQYKARAWELDHHASISPHDCLGTNIDIQTLRNKVMRVLPRVNESINECWIADRDRFSYDGVNSEDRLTRPMIKRGGKWEEVDWTAALAFAVQGLRNVVNAHGGDQLGFLAAPGATLEEFYLLQKLARTLGSQNIDHRLRQSDACDDANAPLFPYLGQSIPELEQLDAALLIGANPRKDQPLIGLRLRKAAKRGAKILAINALDYDFTYPLAQKLVVSPPDMITATARVARAAAEFAGKPLPETAGWLRDVQSDEAGKAMARTLMEAKSKTVLFGLAAAGHSCSATLRALAEFIAEMTGATFGFLPEANSVAGWLAGCVPHRTVAGGAVDRPGRATAAMLRERLKAYVVFGAEPEIDSLNGANARAAMNAAEFVVMISSFKPSHARNFAIDYADVCLPLATFSETPGTHVNAEGRRQTFAAAATPKGESRPGWKILRVLGTMMQLPGFEQNDIDDVRAEIALDGVRPDSHAKGWRLPVPTPAAPLSDGQLYRIAEVPIYATDAVVRRAPALQATRDNPGPFARLNAAMAARFNVAPGETVLLRMVEGDAELAVRLDERVPDLCVYVPSGFIETCTLGASGPVTLVRKSK